ncbi:MAG: ATP-dependent Clp protease proteolytic subunit [Candidatus Omnitrophica bacterium]|nr:ATP-dependent Clp protease proteolytic subunit [Candidatus Omnitrophota bacterium]
MNEIKKAICFLLVFLSLGFVSFTNTKSFYLVPVRGAIDLGLASFIKRVFYEAKENKIDTVILEIDTFGGRADAALDICKYLEEIKPIKTVAFIHGNAWSAGALIALACQKIIMAPGSSIGSAEPRILGSPNQDNLTDEKIVSAIRAKFKSTAEANGYPVNLAIAMVDKDFEIKLVKLKDKIMILNDQEIEDIKTQYKEQDLQIIKTINPKGKLLNLTALEAKELGLAVNVVEDKKGLFRYLGLEEKDLILIKITWSELLVRFLTHPLISPLLLALGFLGLIFELRIPGWGLSGTLGIIFLSLFFWGHYLAGLANWTEVLIFALGVILLLLEIFVIPGFGIAGIAGIVLITLGIFLGLLKFPLTLPQLQINRALFTFGYGVFILILLGLVVFKVFPKTRLYRRLVLLSSEKKEEGFKSAVSFEKYLGKKGKSLTALRPVGKIEIDGEILDATSEGDFIEKDKEVRVINTSGNQIIVKEV